MFSYGQRSKCADLPSSYYFLKFKVESFISQGLLEKGKKNFTGLSQRYGKIIEKWRWLGFFDKAVGKRC